MLGAEKKNHQSMHITLSNKLYVTFPISTMREYSDKNMTQPKHYRLNQLFQSSKDPNVGYGCLHK